MQSWPAGQTIAGKPYQDLTDAELGLDLTTIPNNSIGDIAVIPWWSQGYSKCLMQIFFQVAITGPVQLLASPLDSSGELLSNGKWELLQGGATGPTFNSGATCGLFVAFDDGLIPGNYIRSDSGFFDPAVSLTLNPVWNKAAFIRFQFLNGSAGALTFEANNRIMLAGS